MHVKHISVRNFKKIKEVDLHPPQHTVWLGGWNGNGKSSLLDALWWALAGHKAGVNNPIREGAAGTEVIADLGEYTVTRKQRLGGKSTVALKTEAGHEIKSPQATLDSLLGRYSFDPMKFAGETGKQQVDSLLEVAGLPFDLAQLDADRQALFDQRTKVGQQGKAIGTLPDPHPDVPEAEQSAGELVRQVQAAQDRHRHNAARMDALEALNARISETEVWLANAREELAALGAEVDALPAAGDIESLQQQLESVEATNALVRENASIRERKAAQDALRAEYDDLTAGIAKIDKTKADGVASANLPAGLGFNETGVTLNGVPFADANTAEKIRASVAMALAAKPHLRVGRTTDGSLLDPESLALLGDLAEEHDFQLWIELVGTQTNGGLAIEFILEDGELKND